MLNGGVRTVAPSTEFRLIGREQILLVSGMGIMALLAGRLVIGSVGVVRHHGRDLVRMALAADLLPRALQRVSSGRCFGHMANRAFSGSKRLVLIGHQEGR